MQPIIEVRFAMVTNGYTSIIPVIGKKPVLDQWEKTKNVSREMLESWSLNCPRANNTGILTRLVPTLDLDLLQENAATAAENLVRNRFDGLGLYEAAVVKGISVVFSDLDSLWLRMLCAVKPRSREAVRRRRRA